VELRSLYLHRPTPPPAEEGKQGQAGGEEGEGRGFGDVECEVVECDTITTEGEGLVKFDTKYVQ